MSVEPEKWILLTWTSFPTACFQENSEGDEEDEAQRDTAQESHLPGPTPHFHTSSSAKKQQQKQSAADLKSLLSTHFVCLACRMRSLMPKRRNTCVTLLLPAVFMPESCELDLQLWIGPHSAAKGRASTTGVKGKQGNELLVWVQFGSAWWMMGLLEIKLVERYFSTDVSVQWDGFGTSLAGSTSALFCWWCSAAPIWQPYAYARCHLIGTRSASGYHPWTLTPK